MSKESEVGEIYSETSANGGINYGGSPIMRHARTPSGVAKVNSAGEIIGDPKTAPDITQSKEFAELFGANIANQFREKAENNKTIITPGTGTVGVK